MKLLSLNTYIFSSCTPTYHVTLPDHQYEGPGHVTKVIRPERPHIII